MEAIAGRAIERFTPHDFRRTMRSNTKRLGIDFETAEAMLNHVKKGLERTYDRYDLEEEKRASFLRWEHDIATLARNVGVAQALGVPSAEHYATIAAASGNEAGLVPVGGTGAGASALPMPQLAGGRSRHAAVMVPG